MDVSDKYGKSNDLLLIEKCFFKIKQKENVKENLRIIENAIRRSFNLNFRISIVQNTNSSFFGMNIYPSISTMDLLIESIVTKKSPTADVVRLWHDNDEWFLEIDSLLLDDMSLQANPGEITAVMLHEIGHIVYSNTIPEKLSRILRFSITKLNYTLQALIADKKIRKLFNITIVESCSTKSFNYINNNKERIADSFVVKVGYGEDLDSFIGKLIRTQGNSLVNVDNKDLDKELTAIVNWSIVNIKELEFRKKKLRDSLKVEMVKTPSQIIQFIVQDIYKNFFGDNKEKYRQLLSEQYSSFPNDIYAELKAEEILIEDVKRIVREASNDFFDKSGKLKKITQNEIDILYVEVDKIETNDDKIYLLDKVYELKELVELGLDYIATGREKKVPYNKTTLLSMKDQLEKIRTEAIAVKVLDKEYGLYIRYPKGYEG